jgi:hypothetical protein
VLHQVLEDLVHGVLVEEPVIYGPGVHPIWLAGLLTAVENGGAGRSKMVALGCVDLP